MRSRCAMSASPDAALLPSSVRDCSRVGAVSPADPQDAADASTAAGATSRARRNAASRDIQEVRASHPHSPRKRHRRAINSLRENAGERVQAKLFLAGSGIAVFSCWRETRRLLLRSRNIAGDGARMCRDVGDDAQTSACQRIRFSATALALRAGSA